MTKETLRQTVNTITHLDSMKAVKVAFDLSESNQDSINKVMQVVGGNVDNKNISQIFFYFYLGEGGPTAHKHRLKKN